jgi:hypothetical protein
MRERLTLRKICHCGHSNMLALAPDGEQPRSRIVGPKLSYMDERIAAIDLVITKLVRGPYSTLIPVRLSASPVEKAIPKDEFYRRWFGSSPCRCAQGEGMALGLLGANVDNLAHSKIWCVH